jgi:predicted small lipoprotein YifL
MRNTTFKASLLAASVSIALVACGGGDDGPGYDANTASTPPDTASASTQGFIDFIASLANASVDGREAYDLSAFNLPTNNVDTLEPARTSIDQ